MQGEAVSMWSALIMLPATMRADITQAARFMGGGKRFMAEEPLSQAAEGLREGVTLSAVVAV